MNQGVSVIICCYNSAARLPKTLSYLAKQRVDSSITWEIIVVDNASTDDTESVTFSEWSKHKKGIYISVVKEHQPGLSFARKKGVEVSNFNIVIFCDDDNWLDEDYIQSAYDVMENNKEIGAMGGKGMVSSDQIIPGWFDQYKRYYACYAQAEQSGELSGLTDFLYGAGLVLRKSACVRVYALGTHFLVTDRSGANLMSGGDNELSYLLRLLGYKLWYSDQLKFYHFMPAQRLTKQYLYSLVNSIAYSSMLLIMYQYVLAGKKVNRGTWVSDIIYRLFDLIKSILKSLTIKGKFERKIMISKAWLALLAIVKQAGNYLQTYRSLLKIKQYQ